MRNLDYRPRIFNTVTTVLIVCLLLITVLTGCSTTVPVTAKFPEPPGRGAMTACPDLQKLSTDPKLSDVAKIVTMNYTAYYECAVKADAWIEWYHSQRKIFESVK